MPFVNVFIESSCDIRIENNNLVLSNKEKKATYPIEDINCVMIDCLYSNVSFYTMQKLSEMGATLIICNEKHLPQSTLLPLSGYYKRLEVLEKQRNISKPKIKNLWQKIIKQKIYNQAVCLEINDKDGAKSLFEIAKEVVSGDATNQEARGAVIYFKNLFYKGFTRDSDDFINTMLNYAYSVVRSLVCRELCARGFECAFGIFHKNKLNAFNLADDVIEPFRPIVDNYVIRVCNNENSLTSNIKRKLFSVVNVEVISGSEKHSLSNAVERFVESILSFYFDKSDKLCMPEICGINSHSYE